MTQEPNTIKSRLEALAGVVLDNSQFNRSFLPAIKTLLSKWMKDANEEDIRAGIIELRDKYIPWVLDGNMPVASDPETISTLEAQHENTPQE